jgi:hypothetical protein
MTRNGPTFGCSCVECYDSSEFLQGSAASSIDGRGLISARECQMLAYNESAHAFFKWDPAKGEYPNLVLFAIWDQRSEDQSASDEYGRFIVTPGA